MSISSDAQPTCLFSIERILIRSNLSSTARLSSRM
jgi:hypothetical protein